MRHGDRREPRASLADLEDEVMCLECGTALNQSHAPVAERERAFIRREIARGRTKAQIKDALVDRFGPAVLALPEEEGFGLAAYLVPLLVALLATVGVFAAARRWRRPAPDAAAPHRPDAEDEQRLERELAAYDHGLAGTGAAAAIGTVPALPLDEAGKYVAGGYVVFVALVLVYVAIMAAKLQRLDRDLSELVELEQRRTKRTKEHDGHPDGGAGD